MTFFLYISSLLYLSFFLTLFFTIYLDSFYQLIYLSIYQSIYLSIYCIVLFEVCIVSGSALYSSISKITSSLSLSFSLSLMHYIYTPFFQYLNIISVSLSLFLSCLYPFLSISQYHFLYLFLSFYHVF